MKKQMLSKMKKGVILILVLLLLIVPSISYAAYGSTGLSIIQMVTQRYKDINQYKDFLEEVYSSINKIDTSISTIEAKAQIIKTLSQITQKNNNSTSISSISSQLATATLSSNASSTTNLLTDIIGKVTNLLSTGNKALQSLKPTEEVTINASTAGKETGQTKYNVKLAGKIYQENENSNKWALLLHGVTMNAQAMADAVGQMYIDQGYNILAIDSRGHGDSEGSVAMGYLESLDVWDWLTYLNNEYNCEKIIIHGVSLGGATTVFAASGLDLKSQNVIGVVEDCGYTSLTGIITGMLGGTDSSNDTVTEEETSLVTAILNLPANALSSLVGSPATESLIKTALINLVDVGLTEENFDQHQNALDGIKENCEVPMLIIHGKTDTTVPFVNSTNIYNAVMENDKIPYVQRFIAEGEPHAFVIIGNKYNVYEAHVENFVETAEGISEGDIVSKVSNFKEPVEEKPTLITSLLKSLKLIKNMLF